MMMHCGETLHRYTYKSEDTLYCGEMLHTDMVRGNFARKMDCTYIYIHVCIKHASMILLEDIFCQTRACGHGGWLALTGIDEVLSLQSGRETRKVQKGMEDL